MSRIETLFMKDDIRSKSAIQNELDKILKKELFNHRMNKKNNLTQELLEEKLFEKANFKEEDLIKRNEDILINHLLLSDEDEKKILKLKDQEIIKNSLLNTTFLNGLDCLGFEEEVLNLKYLNRRELVIIKCIKVIDTEILSNHGKTNIVEKAKVETRYDIFVEKYNLEEKTKKTFKDSIMSKTLKNYTPELLFNINEISVNEIFNLISKIIRDEYVITYFNNNINNNCSSELRVEVK